VKKYILIAAFFSTALLSFTAKGDSEIYGTWKGGFGNQTVIIETIVELKQHNKADVFEGAKTEANRCTGAYEVIGDTAFVLTYIQPCTNKKVLLQGNLNRTKNFVDGTWQSASEVKGNFYLQKQSL
jgi:hypothetical protein